MRDVQFESLERIEMKRHPAKALSAAKIRNAGPGRYCDGNGLYLVKDDSGAMRWILRTVIKGKRCDVGLGGLSLISLREAREEAARLRRIARKGGDPLAERRKERRSVPTFEQAARKVHELHSASFRNAKHAAQWINTLATYVFPVFGSRSLEGIESADVLAALSPIWNTKLETARRVRQRIKTVFDWAKASGYRSGDNPVDGISRVLPKHDDKKAHHPALPYAQVLEFLIALHECTAGIPAKLAFEFLILTAARTSEVLLATWKEIDPAGATWTVPGERMKAKEEHKVPLSRRCLEILESAKKISAGAGYVFPGRDQQHPMSNMVFEMTLRRTGRVDITTHGFRSSFRDWAEECTRTQRSVVEAALAHKVSDKVEAAYLRTTLFEKRRRLMDSWAAFATAKSGAKVVNIRA
jgi:integrase